MSETDIVRSITDYLALKRVLFIRNNTGALKTERGSFIRFGSAGSPDIIAFLDGGVAIGIECKTPSGRMSPAQLEWKARAEDIGMTYLVAYSIDDVVPHI